LVYTHDWDENKPAGTRALNLGDDDIREFKAAIRERLQGGGMYFPSTDDDDAGIFNYVKFKEQSGNPTSEANRAFLFTKDVSGVTELYWMDSGGNVIQLTTGGKILISSLAIGSEARGDVIVRGASAWGRTAIGSSGNYLRSDGTDPSWNTLEAADLTAVILTPKEYTDVEDTTTSDESTTNAAYQDTALSITFTVGKQGLTYVSFDGGGHSDSGTGKWAIIVDGVTEKEIAHIAGSGDSVHPLSMCWHGVLSAAAHTIKIQIKNDGGGGATHIKGATSTARLNVSHPT